MFVLCTKEKESGRREKGEKRRNDGRQRGNDAKPRVFFLNDKTIIYKQLKHHLILQRI